MAINLQENDQDKIMAEINMTPLIDIMLVLLIIFMVTSSIALESGLDIDLPQTKSKTARKEAIRILSDVVDGRDLAAIRDEEKAALTVAQLCGLYLADAEGGKVLTKFGVPKKASTIATDCLSSY